MDDEVIRVRNRFYILSTSALVDDRTRVLKQGESFAVFDRRGDILPLGPGEQGLFHEGTRFLSRMILRLGQDRPVLLSSTVKEDSAVLAVDLTNPDIRQRDRVIIPRGTLHVFRAKFLWGGSCYERIRFLNYGRRPVDVSLSFELDADFADIFEVRGVSCERRGRKEPPLAEEEGLRFRYEGRDGVARSTQVRFSPPPSEVSASRAEFHFRLEGKQEKDLFLTVACQRDGAGSPLFVYGQALQKAESALRAAEGRDCHIYTSNEQFNDWLNRSFSDLRMLISDTEKGLYPYGGIPWFCTPFGRDGLITAFQTLWVNPDIARGVLRFLAATQAREVDLEKDAEPGKILHETRLGEMAALGEIPFGRYYGSVDAPPLLVALAGAYYTASGDRGLIEEISPNIELALEWMDTYGDADRDGFVEYLRSSEEGLLQQGWKDSPESVFHADGCLAEGPIALCEVQGYVYAAKVEAAKLADLLGRGGRARDLRRQAEELQQRFEKAFWCEELSVYSFALDGEKRPCRVRSSNPGHCLFAGIAAPERAQRLAETLLSNEMFSGWGIRTLASSEKRYNPMSYHNGSVWPHDNALIALGLAHYRLKGHVLRLLTGLFDASLSMDLHRMPELFCGFHRRPGEGPTLYPVACAPQAWAAGAVFMFLQACLGLSIDVPRRQVQFCYPVLPPFLQEVHIKNLRVGQASLDIDFHRHPDDVGINITRRTGPVEVLALK